MDNPRNQDPLWPLHWDGLNNHSTLKHSSLRSFPSELIRLRRISGR
jgi:hypothetical protein